MQSFSSPAYRPDIDGLRALAVLSVVVFHAFPVMLSGGFVGVDVFFVISGFLISTILFKNLARGSFSFIEFYARRIRRIFPALILVFLASLLAGWFVMLAHEYEQLAKHTIAGALFGANFILWQEAGYFDPVAASKTLLHLWSLGIEEQFYIIWPLLLWCASKLKLNLLLVTIAIAITSFVLNIRGVNVSHDLVATFYSPQTRFWELLLGAILAYLTLYPSRFMARVTIGQIWITELTAAIGLGLFVFAIVVINKFNPFPGWWALLPTLSAVFLIAAGPNTWINRNLLANKWMVGIGLISYPLYLWHWPILGFTKLLFGGEINYLTSFIGLIIALLLSILTYLFVEKPLRKLQNYKNFSLGTLAVFLIIIMLGILTFSFYLYTQKGLDKRLHQLTYIDPGPVVICDPNHPEKIGTYFCIRGNAESKKKIVIYGDSHLGYLTGQLLEKLGKEYELYFFSGAGCWMGEKKLFERNAEPWCADIIERIKKMQGADIYAVITSQRWHGYPIESDELIREAIVDRLHVYNLKPKKIVIIGGVGDIDLMCELAKHRRLVFNTINCEETKFEKIQGAPSRLLNQKFIAASKSLALPASIKFVYPYNYICPNDHCIFSVDSTPNYGDFVHLTFAGGEMTAREIAQFLKE